MRAYFWRSFALVMVFPMAFGLSIFLVYRAHASFRSFSLPLAILMRGASLVLLFFSTTTLPVVPVSFFLLKTALGYRPLQNWDKVQVGMTSKQVVDLLGEPKYSINFGYVYDVPASADDSSGAIWFDDNGVAPEERALDRIPDFAKVKEKSPDQLVPGSPVLLIFGLAAAAAAPLIMAALVIFTILSLIPFSLRSGWNSWTLYMPLLAALSATLWEFGQGGGWRFDRVFSYPMYMVIAVAWIVRVWRVMKGA